MFWLAWTPMRGKAKKINNLAQTLNQANKPKSVSCGRLRFMKIVKNDYRFVSVNGDVGFSAERNRQVIENVIKESEKYAREKRREHSQQVKERTSAVAEFLKSVDAGGKETDIKKYFGEKYLTHLKGQEILEKIRQIKVVKGQKVYTRDA